MSSSAPCAPSNRMRLPSRRFSSSSDQTESMNGSTFGATAARWSYTACGAISAMPSPRRSALWCASSRSILPLSTWQVGEVHQPDRAAADLVLVGRADAAAGGADRALAGGLFAGDVELLMQRQDQRDVLGDAQVLRRHRDALLLEPVDLVDQRLRIEHDAVADHRQLVAHHAGRQQRQLVGGAVDDQRVAGVVPALKAHDDVGLLGQPIDDLALAFVAPLRADHHHIRHAKPSPGPAAPRAHALQPMGHHSG